ncbi:MULTISPECIES: histone-like nucleoid-structuring protein, MvaT/MvaU family [Pseudomonas]|uniref:histone-like nucleoid-structuring protein, MvaT/MvaU family n=1 Tax=Pseudomonas TaxID=286 RepID=UPI000D6F4446|nr:MULTISPECIES: histone-like nucleoid-structuring protein, MvaT/MvaU family [unclassified Pseudomonas]MED5608709.1 histone-like nucleoid-structuring protein, MvaT/MvaU family [Pseudomonas sp. JH-2]PWU26664.1 hypothetical protein DK254_29395 [Pseudomonas sp. RW407]
MKDDKDAIRDDDAHEQDADHADQAFVESLRELMGEYDKSLEDVIEILETDVDWIANGHQAKGAKYQKIRARKVYRNPHTGETVRTNNRDHKTLLGWKDAYGEDVVESWILS